MRIFQSVRVKLVVMFLLVSIIPLAFVTALNLTIGVGGNVLEQEKLRELEDVAEFKGDRLDSIFRELRKDMRIAKEDGRIRTALPVVEKLLLDRANPTYKAAKRELDNQLKILQRTKKFDDIFLVSLKGKIIYASNEAHEAESLGSALPYPSGEAFYKGQKGIFFSDVFRDEIKGNALEVLVTGPVRDPKGKVLGVLAFEVNIDPMLSIVEDRTGLGDSGETLFAKREGSHALFLSPLRFDPDAALKRKAAYGEQDAFPIQEATQGRKGSGLSVDYRGEQVMAAWQYIPSCNWGLVVKIDQEEAFAVVGGLRKVILITMPAVAIVVLLVGLYFARRFTRPITELTKAAGIISTGDLSPVIRLWGKDEVGDLAISMNRMTESLREATAERERNTWLGNGQAQLEERIRGDQPIDELCKNIITFIANYLQVQVGTLYINDDETNFKLGANYAVKDQESLPNEIKTGEGLIGQAALEKKSKLIANVPDDYLTVISGLGEEKPTNILVMPFVYNNSVAGVLEVGSFGDFSELETTFLEQVSERIAIAINSAQSRVELAKALKKSQGQAEEMESQQGELRAANEELEEQTQRLQASEEQLKTQQEELQALNEELEEKARALEERNKNET